MSGSVSLDGFYGYEFGLFSLYMSGFMLDLFYELVGGFVDFDVDGNL